MSKVQGHHQDDKIDYDNLPHQAQQNCVADTETVYYQSMHERYRPTIPIITTNQAQLHIQNRTINTQYKSAICEAITAPALWQYIRECNNWSSATMLLFHEESHWQALERMTSRHVQLVKLCNDIVPMAKTTHCYNPQSPASCMHCTHLVEDFDHLLCCEHIIRKCTRLDVLLGAINLTLRYPVFLG